MSLYCLQVVAIVSMHSSAQVPLLHRRAPTGSLFDIWDFWMYTRVREGGGCRERTGGVGHGWGGSVFVVGFGGNGWDVPVLVACTLACFIIAASTPVLLVLYVTGVPVIYLVVVHLP